MASYPQRDDGNGRVSNAILSTKLDRLIQDVQDMCGRMDRRMAFLEEKHEVDVSEIRARCQENTTQVARLEERQKSTTNILTALNLVIGGIAATIGAMFK